MEVEQQVEKIIEAEQEYFEIDNRTARDVVGKRGSVYIQEIGFCAFEELPVAYQSQFLHQTHSLPDDIEDVTPELVQESRESHTDDNRPISLELDGYIHFKVERHGVTFDVYEPRSRIDLEKLANYCNVSTVADLYGQGVPLEKWNECYRVNNTSIGAESYLFPGSYAAVGVSGFFPLIMAFFGVIGGFFTGAITAMWLSGVWSVLGIFVFVLTVCMGYYGTKAVAWMITLVMHRIKTGEWWSKTPYGKNFRGWFDFVF